MTKDIEFQKRRADWYNLSVDLVSLSLISSVKLREKPQTLHFDEDGYIFCFIFTVYILYKIYICCWSSHWIYFANWFYFYSNWKVGKSFRALSAHLRLIFSFFYWFYIQSNIFGYWNFFNQCNRKAQNGQKTYFFKALFDFNVNTGDIKWSSKKQPKNQSEILK